MMKMCMVNNFMKISVVVVLFMGWCGQVLGARNKFLGANETNVDHDQLAPADAPSLGLGCPTHGLCKIIEDLNYKCEEHNVTTKDGFILSVQRIPSTKDTGKPREQVVLQHGVFGDGANWIVTGKESLAFVLADSGFDVWLFNGRGTQYSRRHNVLQPLDFEYWNWSWDDMAKLDVTAEIEYVASHTAQRLHYVGHSMGTLMMLSLLAERAPVTSYFIKSASLLSPIAHLNHITNQFGSVAASVFLADVSYWLGIGRFNIAEKPVTEFARLICSFNGVDCSNILDAVTGVNCCIDTKTAKRYLAHEPQPTSVKTLVHFAQNVRDGVVKRFDYGDDEKNMMHYGSPKPPVYDLSNILPSFPLYLAYGGADTLSDIVDMLYLIKHDLKNHEIDKLVLNFTFDYAHMDYLLAHNVREKVYDPMMKFMKTFKDY